MGRKENGSTGGVCPSGVLIQPTFGDLEFGHDVAKAGLSATSFDDFSVTFPYSCVFRLPGEVPGAAAAAPQLLVEHVESCGAVVQRLAKRCIARCPRVSGHHVFGANGYAFHFAVNRDAQLICGLVARDDTEKDMCFRFLQMVEDVFQGYDWEPVVRHRAQKKQCQDKPVMCMAAMKQAFMPLFQGPLIRPRPNT